VQRVLIVNPQASNLTEERAEAAAAALAVRPVYTEWGGHATELAREAGAATVWVLGGDGTVNEALNGLHPDAILGVLPAGRTNVFARALGKGAQRRISLGRVNGRRFGFAAGIGLDAELLRRAGRGRGDLAMLWTALRLPAFEPALEVRGFGEAASVLVANGEPYTYLGRVPVRVARGARFELGLDFVAPRRLHRRDYARVARYLLTGRGGGFLRGHDLDRIEIACRMPLPLQADGEDLGDVTEAVFEAERDAVSILVG
jgi:diacylglycerol kinase family enzyme